MSDIYIACTASCDQQFPIWNKEGGGTKGGRPAEKKQFVLIQGKANVADPRTLITPEGAVLTKVTPDALAVLEKDNAFQKMVKDGFMQVIKGKKPAAAKAKADMEAEDKSAPEIKEKIAKKVKAAGKKATKVTAGKISEGGDE